MCDASLPHLPWFDNMKFKVNKQRRSQPVLELYSLLNIKHGHPLKGLTCEKWSQYEGLGMCLDIGNHCFHIVNQC